MIPGIRLAVTLIITSKEVSHSPPVGSPEWSCGVAGHSRESKRKPGDTVRKRPTSSCRSSPMCLLIDSPQKGDGYRRRSPGIRRTLSRSVGLSNTVTGRILHLACKRNTRLSSCLRPSVTLDSTGIPGRGIRRVPRPPATLALLGSSERPIKSIEFTSEGQSGVPRLTLRSICRTGQKVGRETEVPLSSARELVTVLSVPVRSSESTEPITRLSPPVALSTELGSLPV